MNERAHPASARHRIPTVAAGVDQRVNAARRVARNDDGRLAHLAGNVVARFGDLGFMGEKKPAAPEQALQLGIVHFRIGKDAAADQTTSGVDGAGHQFVHAIAVL